ncbi:hypothetical protein [Rubrobacter radiotolerans]|uniref:Uncharacterized protein n=1 Tax=Rubrobacter radiotolerans TaxID=42256 RepID=A0AB35T2S1_RUBRA|nr:hypothetical protein [Rubrobacter radiotolerans]MDX5894159.1 hypothetical protein [Rubrobacter radiotolerans]
MKENRVIPPVLAVVALLVFSWVVAGSFLSSGADESISNRQGETPPAEEEIAQSETPTQAPEIEAPNAESFAVYESKDPFRRLFSPATPQETTVPDDATTTATPGGPGTGGFGTDGQRRDTTTAPGGQGGAAPGATAVGDQYGSWGQDGFAQDDFAQDGFAQDDLSGDPITGGTGATGGTGGESGLPRGTGDRPDNLFESGGDLPPPENR